MPNLVMPALPLNMDHYVPESCFCGKKTVESHSYWFCSAVCARQDSLRSLDDPECHYRNIVRKAYVQAGILELYPHCMVSAGHLRPGPSQQRRVANSPPFFPPTNSSHQRRGARARNMAKFPTLSQVTGKVLANKAEAGSPLVATRQDRPRWEGFPNARLRARTAQRPQEPFKQIAFDPIPLPERIPARSPRGVPTNDILRSSIRKSVTTLLNLGRSQRDGENPERVSVYPVDAIAPSIKEESPPSHCQNFPANPDPTQSSKALRRSVSFAGWDKDPHSGPPIEHNIIMHIIEELRGVSGNFDPRSLFDLEDTY